MLRLAGGVLGKEGKENGTLINLDHPFEIKQGVGRSSTIIAILIVVGQFNGSIGREGGGQFRRRRRRGDLLSAIVRYEIKHIVQMEWNILGILCLTDYVQNCSCTQLADYIICCMRIRVCTRSGQLKSNYIICKFNYCKGENKNVLFNSHPARIRGVRSTVRIKRVIKLSIFLLIISHKCTMGVGWLFNGGEARRCW